MKGFIQFCLLCGPALCCVYYIALKINKAPFMAICIGITSGRSIQVFIWLQCSPLWWPSQAPPRPRTWSRPGAGHSSAWWRAATPGPRSPGSSTTRSTLQWNMWVDSVPFRKAIFSFTWKYVNHFPWQIYFVLNWKKGCNKCFKAVSILLSQCFDSHSHPTPALQVLFASNSAKSIKG